MIKGDFVLQQCSVFTQIPAVVGRQLIVTVWYEGHLLWTGCCNERIKSGVTVVCRAGERVALNIEFDVWIFFS